MAAEALRVAYEQRSVADALSEPGVLAVFEFGASPLTSTDPRHVPVALTPLDGHAPLETWRGEGPVETGEDEGFRFARAGRLTMAQLALDLRDHPDMRAAAFEAYARLRAFLRGSPHHCPLKIWNYVPGINEGEGDRERYRQFCVGRAEALEEAFGEQPPLPAATAIGTPADEPALQLYLLAGDLPGLNVENPRQVNAWHYPRQYGPRSPLFSRGTILQLNGERQFLISGTASVVGHETHHDTAAEQILESLRNVEALLAEGRRVSGMQASAEPSAGAVKIYVRRADDLPAIRGALDGRWPSHLPHLFLQGDVCRRDLLAELDGILPLN